MPTHHQNAIGCMRQIVVRCGDLGAAESVFVVHGDLLFNGIPDENYKLILGQKTGVDPFIF
jgi:hypothetical protein